MKLVLVIFSVVFIYLTKANYRDEFVDLLKTLREECKNETKVDYDKFLKVKETGHVDRSDRKLMEFIYCAVRNAGFVDDEGNINMDLCKSHLVKLGLDGEVADKVNQLCATIKGTKKIADLPLLMSDYFECYYKNLPKGFITI